MANIFTKHPALIGETYGVHFKFAFCFGSQMVLGGLACMIHSLFPFFFQRTGTNTVRRLAALCQSRCEQMDAKKDSNA